MTSKMNSCIACEHCGAEIVRDEDGEIRRAIRKLGMGNLPTACLACAEEVPLDYAFKMGRGKGAIKRYVKRSDRCDIERAAEIVKEITRVQAAIERSEKCTPKTGGGYRCPTCFIEHNVTAILFDGGDGRYHCPACGRGFGTAS